MEKHVCEFNDRWGIRGKEESFIKQGHQTGIQENQRYAGLTNFVKKLHPHYGNDAMQVIRW
jgi:hypothetical protein